MPDGAIITRARKDLQNILGGFFSVELTITAKDINGDVLPDFSIQGLASRTRGINEIDEATPSISKLNYCSLPEVTLNELGYTTRNAKGDVIVKGWLVSWTDVTGTRKYKIEEPMPDETVGNIKCLLGEYE